MDARCSRGSSALLVTGSPSSALSLTSLDPFVPHRVLSHNPPDIDIAHPRLHITLPVSVLQTPCLLLCFHSPTLFHLQPGEVFNLFIYFSLLVQHLWTSCSLGNPANSSALWCTRRPASPVCHLFLLLFFSFSPPVCLDSALRRAPPSSFVSPWEFKLTFFGGWGFLYIFVIHYPALQLVIFIVNANFIYKRLIICCIRVCIHIEHSDSSGLQGEELRILIICISNPLSLCVICTLIRFWLIHYLWKQLCNLHIINCTYV